MMLIQLIHGIQFMSYYMGAIFYLKSALPDHLYGSVHGLYFLVGNAPGGITGNVLLGRLLNCTLYREYTMQVLLLSSAPVPTFKYGFIQLLTTL